MGKRKYRKPYSQVQEEANQFEQRWNAATESFFLFNPHTGETIADPSGYVNRKYSLWAPVEMPSKYCAITTLYSEFYASRRWGRRRFEKPLPYDTATTLLTAVARGFLARLKLRKYFNVRYCRILDASSGYYYFHDNCNPEGEASWYKPILAFPGDIPIREIRPEDPADFMGSQKYTYREFTNGPYLRRPTLGAAGKKVRAENTHFLFVDPRIALAVHRPEEIDIEEHPLGSAVWMMDGLQVKDVYLSDYAVIRTARHNNNAAKILEVMKAYPDRLLMQLYGTFALSTIDVILDSSNSLTLPWRTIMDQIFEVVIDKEKCIPLTLKAFSLRALHNILCIPAGRGHFWDTSSDSPADPYMEGRAGKRIVYRLKTLNR